MSNKIKKHDSKSVNIFFSAFNSTLFLTAQTSLPEYVKFAFSFPFWMAVHGMPLYKHS